MSVVADQLNITADTVIQSSGGTRDAFLRFALSMTDGTADNQFNLNYSDQRTITSSGTPDQVDLNGTLIGSNFALFNAVEITTIIIAHYSLVQTLTLGGSGHTFSSMFVGTNPGIVLPPAPSVLIPTLFILNCQKNPAYPVVAGSADILQMKTDGGSNIPYLIFLKGRNA